MVPRSPRRKGKADGGEASHGLRWQSAAATPLWIVPGRFVRHYDRFIQTGSGACWAAINSCTTWESVFSR